MTVANRVQLASVRESTLGTTPNTPRMRLRRFVSESLSFTPDYIDSDEIRSDRMLGDPIKVMQASQGAIPGELSYPVDESPLSEDLRSAFFNTWVNTPQADNDGTADSVITDVATTNTVLTATWSGTVQVGHLVKATNFGVANNNGVFRCTTASATVPRFVGSGITDEAAPPANARVKVVGCQGVAGDIDATATGLQSTLLVFTNMGLAVGQWVKIGGTATGDKFVTAALNDWVRITAITATTLTFDNRPSGWTTETGTGLTIKIWFGDQIRNGTTRTSQSIEKGFLAQTVPTYIVNTGMVVNTMDVTMTSKQKIGISFAYMGMGGSQSTTALDASPDARTTGQVMAGNANVGRVGEAGSQVTSPNWAREVTFQINNNLRTLESVDQSSPVHINEGECTVTGKLSSYFGDNALLAKLYAGTATSLNSRVAKNSQALVFSLPRVTMRTGNPAVTGKNTDVMLDADFTASIDTTYTNATVLLDRLEYFE